MAEQKEILESIRDIVSGKAPAGDDDILDLTQMVNADGSVSELKKSQSKIAPSEPSNDVLSDIDSLLSDVPKPGREVELEFKPKPEKFDIAEEFSPGRHIIAPREDDKMSKPDRIISGESAEAAKSAINELTNRLKKNGKEAIQAEPAAPFRNGDTVEDLVVEMLKPMMKDWLDKNLPKLVNQ